MEKGVFTSTFTYPLTARVVGAPQMSSQGVSSKFLFSTALWDLANSRPFHSLTLFSHLLFCLHCCVLPRVSSGGVEGAPVKRAPLTSGNSLSQDRRDHRSSADTQLSLIAPRPFFNHTLDTVSAGDRNLDRGSSSSSSSSIPSPRGSLGHHR